MSLSPDPILQVGFGFWGAKALHSAVELGLFTELCHGPLELNTLTERLGLHPRGARDFFDALVALGLLKKNGYFYSNTVEAAFFLDKAKPSYIGGILEMAGERSYPCWGKLKEALLTGNPQNEVKDENEFFETFYKDPERMKKFLQAMTGISLAPALQIVRKFPWQQHRTFADIGTAQGGVAVQISWAQPHLRGIGFDLPPVRPYFEEYVGSYNLSDKIQFEGGDFFKDPLPQAEVLVMGHILHDWDLEQKQFLMQKAYQALPRGGAVIIYEALIDDERTKNAFGLLMSLNMLIETRGGFDFTGAECSGWLRKAGFVEIRVEHLTGPYSMVIGLKK